MRSQTKTGGNGNETDIKIYEEPLVASFRSLLHACDYRIYHIHSGYTAHANGRIHDIHALYVGDRDLEFRITTPDNLN